MVFRLFFMGLSFFLPPASVEFDCPEFVFFHFDGVFSFATHQFTFQCFVNDVFSRVFSVWDHPDFVPVDFGDNPGSWHLFHTVVNVSNF